MDDLIVKLEHATEGSRELDACVWVAVNGKGQPMKEVGPPSYKMPRFFCNPSPDIDWIGYDLLEIAPKYTTSLDAAHSLVPEEWGWTINHDAIAAVYAPEIEGDDDLADWGGAPNGTPAIALCIAVLKARARRSLKEADHD